MAYCMYFTVIIKAVLQFNIVLSHLTFTCLDISLLLVTIRGYTLMVILSTQNYL